MGADASLLSPVAYVAHSSGAPFGPVQRIQRIPHNHKEILARCLHNDKAERGTSKHPDKAPVTKERRGGRSPNRETVGITRGGGGLQSFRPTHPDPPPCNLILSTLPEPQPLSAAHWRGPNRGRPSIHPETHFLGRGMGSGGEGVCVSHETMVLVHHRAQKLWSQQLTVYPAVEMAFASWAGFPI